jgi:DNA-binding beta-propeller fold protein YncE
VSDEFPPAFSEFPIGSQIAGYRLEEQIGRGGMAVVYRAYDVRLDRNVALKILAPGLAPDEAFRKRFSRESKAAAAVDHPNIIPVFDAGEAGGVLFIAMRFVHGRDVRTLLEAEGPLPAERATDIIAQVASALDAAHARGLVHRDVKPANMLLDTLTGSGRRDHVYLSDFGLSKQSLAQFSQTGLTSHGQFLGTFDYVAPEQVEGRRVDGRADEYALACSAFELLSGTPPFRRDGGLAVMWAKLSEPPPLLSFRRADLPEAIDGVMSRALARDPAERYPNCGEFAAALRDACGLGPADDGPPRTMPVATEVAMPVVPAAGPPAAGEPLSRGAAPSGPLAEASGTDRPPGADGSADPGGASGAGGAAAADVSASGGAGGVTEPYGESQFRAGPSHPAPPPAQGTVVAPAPGHPWWRSRAVVSAAAAGVVLAIVGAAFAALHHGGTRGAGTGGGGTAGRLAAVVKAPGCTTATARQTALQRVRSQTASLGGQPFGIAVTADGRYSFVSTGNGVAVLSNHGGSLAPTLVTTIPAPGANKGEALTHDGSYLLAAAGSGAYVINVKEAEAGDTGAALGRLTSPGGMGAVEVSVSPDDDFAFVTLQDSSEMAVFNLPKSLASGLGQSGFVGMVPLGTDPVGIAQSPDGRWLYVAQENEPTSTPAEGKLYVVSMSVAETHPETAVRSSATAGCGPARIIVSANGSDVWVTDRDSNALVAFSADKLLSNPADSIIARVNVGQTPIGVMFIRGGTEIMVADSNLNHVDGADTLTLVSTQRALQGGGSAAVLGFLPSGRTPREFGLEPDGTLLVTDNSSGQLQAIDTGSLP